MAKKPIRAENYLDRVPCRNPDLDFTTDEEGMVTLLVEWKGFYYRLSQKLFHKPRVSQIHMDAYGSFLWSQIDGKKDVMDVFKTVLELALMLLKVLRELLALLRDKKNTRHDPTKD